MQIAIRRRYDILGSALKEGSSSEARYDLWRCIARHYPDTEKGNWKISMGGTIIVLTEIID
ncbi:hypothetical protein [Oryzomonas rubra]|uniref:Uncharacterized protein n=1 Tax=Oryzomonas rubra TaxID=2509454 RepID=A0A5A9X6X3_9BACT|nr:hypothetical protein [Oryzomonas rubra]KAA0888710.1 hypothetical protein ET418_15125 [Oryzomonas rubra]